MRFLVVLALLLCSSLLQGQIVVGGREFARSASEVGAKGEWVIYEKGAPQDEGTRRLLTKRVLIEVSPGLQTADLSKVAGVIRTESRGKYAVVEFAGNPDAAVSGADKLRKVKGVRSAEPMLARQLFGKWVPNDPLFAYTAANPGYQWHLRNTGQNGGASGWDVNVLNTWDSYKGTGIRIGIVDDGLEVTHPDLASNVDLLNDHDFNGNDDDPSPGVENFHGTASESPAWRRRRRSWGCA
jgi:subtilisin family serine protease